MMKKVQTFSFGKKISDFKIPGILTGKRNLLMQN
jgi:hypothetical protein